MTEMSADSFFILEEAPAPKPARKAKPVQQSLFLADDQCGTPDLFMFGE
jgi:hypothetical protein